MSGMAQLFPWLGGQEETQFEQAPQQSPAMAELLKRIRAHDDVVNKLETSMAATFQDGGPEKLSKGDVARNILSNFARGALNARYGGKFDTVQEEGYKRKQQEMAQKRASLGQMLQLAKMQSAANTQMMAQVTRDENADQTLAQRERQQTGNLQRLMSRDQTLATQGQEKLAQGNRGLDIRQQMADVSQRGTDAKIGLYDDLKKNNFLRNFAAPGSAAAAMAQMTPEEQAKFKPESFYEHLKRGTDIRATAQANVRPQWEWRRESEGVDPDTGKEIFRDVKRNKMTGEEMTSTRQAQGVSKQDAKAFQDNAGSTSLINSVGGGALSGYLKGLVNPSDPGAIENWTGPWKGNFIAKGYRRLSSEGPSTEESAFRSLEGMNVSKYVKSITGASYTDKDVQRLEETQNKLKTADSPKTALKHALIMKSLLGMMSLQPKFFATRGGQTLETTSNLRYDEVANKRVTQALKELDQYEPIRGKLPAERAAEVERYMNESVLNPMSMLEEAVVSAKYAASKTAPKPQASNTGVSRPTPSPPAKPVEVKAPPAASPDNGDAEFQRYLELRKKAPKR